MLHKRCISIILVVAFGICANAFGETLSELLESAIYAEETAGDLNKAIRLYKQVVDEADANRKYAAQYGIMSIPTLLIFKGGEIADQIVGVPQRDPKAEIKKRLDGIL